MDAPDDLEAQIARAHLELFGQESAERLAHRAQIIARLRARAVDALGSLWHQPPTAKPTDGHQGEQ